jgi:glutamate-1-semialdehyde 2,1-aminomutase
MAPTPVRGRGELGRLFRVMPGGTVNSWCMPEGRQIIIERGAGAYVADTRGRRYLDFVLGSGPLVLGHAHHAVVRAIREQAARGTHFYAATREALRLAERIVEAVPCAEQVRFTSSGAEATFHALRLARAVTGREKILKFSGSYHGHHDYAMTDGSAGIPAAIRDLVYVARFNDPSSVTAAMAAHGHEIAAVIAEPVHRVVAPRDGFLRFLRDECDRHGCLLVFDEMVTGFRLGPGGAQQRYGVTPDLATLGKVIGGGLPLAAVAGPAALMEYANPRRRDSRSVFFSGTLNGNPLSAAAGIAVLDVLDHDLGYERLRQLGALLRSRLNEVAASTRLPVEVAGEGAIVGLVVGEGARDTAMPGRSGEALKSLDAALLNTGILTNLSTKFYLCTAHTPEEIERACEALGDALHGLEREMAFLAV